MFVWTLSPWCLSRVNIRAAACRKYFKYTFYIFNFQVHDDEDHHGQTMIKWSKPRLFTVDFGKNDDVDWDDHHNDDDDRVDDDRVDDDQMSAWEQLSCEQQSPMPVDGPWLPSTRWAARGECTRGTAIGIGMVMMIIDDCVMITLWLDCQTDCTHNTTHSSLWWSIDSHPDIWWFWFTIMIQWWLKCGWGTEEEGHTLNTFYGYDHWSLTIPTPSSSFAVTLITIMIIMIYDYDSMLLIFCSRLFGLWTTEASLYPGTEGHHSDLRTFLIPLNFQNEVSWWIMVLLGY